MITIVVLGQPVWLTMHWFGFEHAWLIASTELIKRQMSGNSVVYYGPGNYRRLHPLQNRIKTTDEQQWEEEEKKERELSPLESLSRKVDLRAPGMTVRKLEIMLRNEIIELDLARNEKASRRHLDKQKGRQTAAVRPGDTWMFKSVVSTQAPDTYLTGIRGCGWSFKLPKCLQLSSLRARFSQDKNDVERISSAPLVAT